MKINSLLSTIFLMCSFMSFGQGTKDTLNILFVGNSFTYFYNLPQVVNAMSEYSDSIYLKTSHSLVGGSKISEHLKGEKNTQTIEILNKEKFDYVVINHHSLAPFENVNTFLEDSKEIVSLVKSKNAVPIFMMTWAYHSNPLMLKTLSESYKKLGNLLKVDIIPNGELFSEVRKLRPDLILFDDDDKHPSKHGTYLNALTFFKYFINRSTSEIPKRISTLDKNNQKLWLLFLSQENADFLQQLVDEYDFKTRLN